MAVKKENYHHGDLRAALIRAADEIISESGIEGFSLRAAAARAGVSPGAPAHHFGSAKGLLTEVALLGFERVDGYLEKVEPCGDVAADMRAVSLAFVRFALDNPGHFRLMFRNDLINRDDPRYAEISHKPGARLSAAVAAYHGKTELDLERFEDAADLFGALSTIHGLAHMVLAEKATAFFAHADAHEFAQRELPRVLERMYPAAPGKNKDGFS